MMPHKFAVFPPTEIAQTAKNSQACRMHVPKEHLESVCNKWVCLAMSCLGQNNRSSDGRLPHD